MSRLPGRQPALSGVPEGRFRPRRNAVDADLRRATDCPTGKSARPPDCHLSSPISKKISLRRDPKSNLYQQPSCPTEGRLEIVTDAGQDAVDASGALDEGAFLRTAKTCGPDTPTLVSSLRDVPRATVARKPGHRGEHEISRKPLRRECRMFPV